MYQSFNLTTFTVQLNAGRFVSVGVSQTSDQRECCVRFDMSRLHAHKTPNRIAALVLPSLIYEDSRIRIAL